MSCSNTEQASEAFRHPHLPPGSSSPEGEYGVQALCTCGIRYAPSLTRYFLSAYCIPGTLFRSKTAVHVFSQPYFLYPSRPKLPATLV